MVEYTFTFADGTVHRFDAAAKAAPATDPEPPPWARLGFYRCANCPLDQATHPYCPPAADIARFTESFRELPSHERVHVRVRREGREYEIHCDLQTGLGSLMGLVMASSECPHVGQLSALTRLHLPFANLEETVFRTVGLYLLKQYFVARDGGTPDFDLQDLARYYDELQVVNRYFKKRIEAASERDANINAVTMLFSLSALVAMSLHSGLDQLREFLFGESGDPAAPRSRPAGGESP
jgi:hypothetical protein